MSKLLCLLSFRLLLSLLFFESHVVLGLRTFYRQILLVLLGVHRHLKLTLLALQLHFFTQLHQLSGHLFSVDGHLLAHLFEFGIRTHSSLVGLYLSVGLRLAGVSRRLRSLCMLEVDICLHALHLKLLLLLQLRRLGCFLHLLDDLGAAHQAAVLDQHRVRNWQTKLLEGTGLLELAVFEAVAGRGAGDHNVVLTDGQIGRDGTGNWVVLVNRQLFRLTGNVVVRDVDDPFLGVVVLDDVQHVTGEDEVGALQVVENLDQIHRTALLLVGDGLGRNILAVEALHRVADVGDALDVLLCLVGDAIQPGRNLVRLNLHRRLRTLLVFDN